MVGEQKGVLFLIFALSRYRSQERRNSGGGQKGWRGGWLDARQGQGGVGWGGVGIGGGWGPERGGG